MADKRELILDLLARNKMGPGTAAASRDLDKLGTSADHTRGQVGKLDNEIKASEKELVKLSRAFAEAGNAGDRMDISKSIRKTQTEIKTLTKNKGILESILPDPEPAGRSFSTKLMASISTGLESAASVGGNPAGLALGVGIAAAAGPTIISGLQSALAAAPAAAAIGGGIALAISSSDELQKAGQTGAKQFMEGLKGVADQAFHGEILKSINSLQIEGDKIVTSWGRAFRELSPYVTPLTNSLIKAVDVVNGALVGAASHAGPALDALGDSIELISDGIANFVTTVADGSPEAADNLRLIAGVTGDLISASGELLNFLGKLAQNEWIVGPLLPILSERYKAAKTSSDDLAGSTTAMASTMTNAEKAAQGEADALVGLAAELKAQTDPAFNFMNSLDKMRKAQQDATDAAKDHGKNSPEYQAALRKEAQAALALEDAAGKVAVTADGEMTPALKSTLQAAGMTTPEIKALGKQLVDARNKGQDFAKKYAANVAVNGIPQAVSKINSLKHELATMKTNWTVTIRQNFLTFGKPYSAAGIKSGNIGGLATGGPASLGTPYIVGEEGPELFVPKTNGMVMTAAETRRILSGAGGPRTGMAGGGGGVIRLDVSGGDADMQRLIRKWIRTGELTLA